MNMPADLQFFSDLNSLQAIAIGYRSSKPLLVALHYDLFSRIAGGLDSSRRLSRKLGLDLRALEILLNALATLGFLHKRNGRYVNATSAKKFLVAGSPNYMGNILKYQELTWDAWSDLRFVLKKGQPRRMLLDWIRKRSFTKDYIRAMGDVARVPARELAARLDWAGVGRTLDVGCGAGTFSAAFVERNPRVRGVLLDLPVTLRVTKELLKEHPQLGRLSFREADFLADSFGCEEFDLILISNVTHVENEANNRRLVQKAYRALKPQGRLVIHDFVIGPDRTVPRFSALLALHLLLFTGKGSVYTLDEYRSWMNNAGFNRISDISIAKNSLHPSVAIVGQKS
ncbi:MAG: methyltransferase domain-containing protein [Elusimicrobia bacterium]|nr:methyltransferase domain-containing protein [Elusimicrobiota bacterium]